MKSPLLFTAILFLISAVSVRSQSKVTGSISEPDGTAVIFANVLLLNAADSSLVKGDITNDVGSFEIEVATNQSFILSASMVGYDTYYSEVFKLDQNTTKDFPNLKLSEGVELEAVQIVARKPLFEQKIDRLVVNVSNSITAAGGTALEVLERSPGVIVNRQNNALSLIGKEGVVVMINGKITYQPAVGIVQMLEGMSADNIASIELITTPPANFDAEGNAGFINIVLKKRTDVGLNGNFSVSAGYGEGEVGSANLSVNYRKNKLNLFGTYSFLLKNQYQEFYNRRKVNFENINTESEVTTFRDPGQENHNIRFGMDYELGEKTIIGLLFGAYNNKWTMDANNEGFTYLDGQLDSKLTLVNDEINQWKHAMGNLNVQHTLSPGDKLNFNIDYLLYNDENPNNYTTSFFDAQNNLLKTEDTRSRKITPINILVGQLDYEKNINEKLKGQVGIKGAYSIFENDVSVEVLENSEWTFVPQFTNESDLEEMILAAYSSFDYKANDKNAFKFGLRYEYTDSELNALKEGKVVDRQFGSFFPSVFYSYSINENQGINLSYNRRITRPTFNDMAPFAIFLDPNTFFFGNAGLQPALSNNYKVDYRLKSNMISIQYTQEDSTIARFQDRVVLATNQQAFEPINLSDSKALSITLGVPVYIKKFWEMQNNFMFQWTMLNSFYEGVPVSLQNASYNISTTQTFILPKDFSLELSGFYRSASISGRSTISPIRGASFGMQKKFANKGGNLRFNITDMFNSIFFAGGTSLPEQGFETDGKFDFSNRTFRLSYSRSFGNNKVKASRKRNTGSEEERRRVN